MVCLTLFSLANFAKALVTKLLSSAFYRTAHFKKVKEALDKVPRRTGRRPPLKTWSHHQTPTTRVHAPKKASPALTLNPPAH